MGFSIRYFVNRFFVIFLVFSLLSCSEQKEQESKTNVIIGISSDVSTLNPLFAMNATEGQILEQLYCGLFSYEWDTSKKEISPLPMLAESWQWSEDNYSITVKLKDNLLWSDSVKITTEDIVFSFDLYSDPIIASRFFGSFNYFELNDDLSINLDNTFESISENEIRINFAKSSRPELYMIDLPLVPKHQYTGIPRDEISNSKINFNPIGCSGYKLKQWNRTRSIILEKNPLSIFANDTQPEELIFKIVPDYNSKILQLIHGEIDFLTEIKAEDVERIRENKNLEVKAIEGRNYDFLAWNITDPSTGKPNKLFGSFKVRKALTLGINKQLIIAEYLGNYGRLIDSPVSPIFPEYFLSSEGVNSYDPDMAAHLLEQEGWSRTDDNSVLEKSGEKFSFTLSISGANQFRKLAAELIKNDLLKLGIEVKIDIVEPNVFFGELMEKKLEAAIVGWSVPLIPDMSTMWHSDPNIGFLNVSGYSNSVVDNLAEEFDGAKDKQTKIKAAKEIQKIFFDEIPVTFLYWIDEIVVYNKRIKNLSIDPIGAVHSTWDWKISE